MRDEPTMRIRGRVLRRSVGASDFQLSLYRATRPEELAASCQRRTTHARPAPMQSACELSETPAPTGRITGGEQKLGRSSCVGLAFPVTARDSGRTERASRSRRHHPRDRDREAAEHVRGIVDAEVHPRDTRPGMRIACRRDDRAEPMSRAPCEGHDHRRESGSAGGMAARERVELRLRGVATESRSDGHPSRTPNTTAKASAWRRHRVRIATPTAMATTTTISRMLTFRKPRS